MMIDFEDRTESDRRDFSAHLAGAKPSSIPLAELLVPWILSLGLLALQCGLIGAAIDAF
jgi:hypothetical protein